MLLAIVLLAVEIDLLLEIVCETVEIGKKVGLGAWDRLDDAESSLGVDGIGPVSLSACTS
ncbi:MAG: hypothetical protein WAM82_23380 [Thermoanaerobaculia bacterium]